jgi:hypothetical protein
MTRLIEKEEMHETKNPALKRIGEFGRTVKIPSEKEFYLTLPQVVDRVCRHFNQKGTNTMRIISLLYIALIMLVGSAQANQIDMAAIKHIESRGNARAVSRTGAVGLYQIMPCVLKEYNQFNRITYSRRDLFNPAVNEAIARWYLTVRIPQMLRAYRIPVTTNNILHAYNAGVGNLKRGIMPRETKNYIQRYNKLTEGGES